MSFCQLGAIGKLFRPDILPAYASFIHIFWNKKPLDWLQVCNSSLKQSCYWELRSYILIIVNSLDNFILLPIIKFWLDPKRFRRKKFLFLLPYNSYIFQRDFLSTTYCSPETSNLKCNKRLKTRLLQVKPSLFQHIGR